MKQAILIKGSSFGIVKVFLRVINGNIFFKYNNSTQAQQVINQLRAKGCKIEVARDWIRVDLMQDFESIRLGEIEIDKDESNELKEDKIFNFYLNEYKKAGFIEKQNEEPI